MKNKYQRLSKLEKKEARQRFKSDPNNALIGKRLNRLEVVCYLGILFGIVVVIYSLLTHDKWFFIAEYGIMAVICLALLFFAKDAMVKKYNDFLISESKNDKKKEKKSK